MYTDMYTYIIMPYLGDGLSGGVGAASVGGGVIRSPNPSLQTILSFPMQEQALKLNSEA